jgi:hypothetical protein
MNRTPIARRPRVLAGAVGALLAATLGATLAAVAPAGPALASPGARHAASTITATPAASIKPGAWVQVTRPLSGTPIIPDIGLARGADGVLHIVWQRGNTPASIVDTPITAAGKVGSQVTVASNWFLTTFPDATATPSGVDAIWNGIKSNSPNSPQGIFLATRPRSGGSWSVSGTVLPPVTATPFTTSPDTATTGSDGKPWVAYDGPASMVVQHVGHPGVQISPATSCCLIAPGLAVDGSSGKTWIAYASLITHHEGIFARPLAASGKPSGAATLLPGSVQGGNVLVPAERIGLASRGRGRAGVYAVYAAGYPFVKSLDVLRLGTKTPHSLATFTTTRQLAGDTIAADPNGRLWVAGFTAANGRAGLFVRRSDTAAGRFGPIENIALPAHTTTVWKVYASAQAGQLDVVALISKNGGSSEQASYWATEVLAPLSMSASASSGGGAARITFTVTDAGTPVSGATVRFCGKHFATPASGKVTFRVRTSARGSATATATKASYAPASLKVRATC